MIPVSRSTINYQFRDPLALVCRCSVIKINWLPWQHCLTLASIRLSLLHVTITRWALVKCKRLSQIEASPGQTRTKLSGWRSRKCLWCSETAELVLTRRFCDSGDLIDCTHFGFFLRGWRHWYSLIPIYSVTRVLYCSWQLIKKAATFVAHDHGVFRQNGMYLCS